MLFLAVIAGYVLFVLGFCWCWYRLMRGPKPSEVQRFEEDLDDYVKAHNGDFRAWREPEIPLDWERFEAVREQWERRARNEKVFHPRGLK